MSCKSPQVEYQKEYELYLRDQFTAADKSKNGFLFLPEFTALLKQLNIDLGEVEVEKVFEEANTDKRTKVGGGKVGHLQPFDLSISKL